MIPQLAIIALAAWFILFEGGSLLGKYGEAEPISPLETPPPIWKKTALPIPKGRT